MGLWTTAALTVAVLGCLGSSISLIRLRKINGNQKALEAADKREGELERALITFLEDDGKNIRARISLPSSEVMKSQINAEVSKMEERLDELNKVNEDLSSTLSKRNAELKKLKEDHDKVSRTLAEVTDKEGHVLVQLRLPGKKIDPPNKTPCGGLCVHGKWINPKEHNLDLERGYWACAANQGRDADYSRKDFLDANNQCVMFERKGE